jgi:hypothetical protein
LANVHPVARAEYRDTPAGIVLDATNSADVDSTDGTNDDIVRFEWFDMSTETSAVLGFGRHLTLPASARPRRIQLKVTDKGGLSGVDDVLVQSKSKGDLPLRSRD